MSALIEDIEVICPYCGQTMEVDIDCTAGNQAYYEDCQVCCAPVRFVVTVDGRANLTQVETYRDDD